MFWILGKPIIEALAGIGIKWAAKKLLAEEEKTKDKEE